MWALEAPLIEARASKMLITQPLVRGAVVLGTYALLRLRGRRKSPVRFGKNAITVMIN
jgi:hypothetical protein